MPTVYENRRPATTIGSERPRRKGEHLDRLTRDAIAAEQAGMSYGNWKALHPHTPEDEPRPAKRDPSEECRNRANKKKTLHRYHNKPPKVTEKPCGYCGKVFPSVRGAKYCCAECYSAATKKMSRERAQKRKEEAQKND